MEEIKFAFVIHPLNKSHFIRLMRQLPILGTDAHSIPLRSYHPRLPSSPVHAITLPFYLNATKLACDVILCPLLPQEMVEDEARAIAAILESVEIAKGRGARIVGLGGFTSIVGNGGLDVAAKTLLPVTTGNTYTASTVVESITIAGRLLNVDFGNSCIAIIGATGDIGTACARGFSGLFGRVILTARNDDRLEVLAELLKTRYKSVSIERRAHEAAAHADVVVTVTSALTTLVKAEDLKRNAIVCDVSYPANVAREVHKERPDILVFEGGIVSSESFVSQVKPKSLFWEFNPHAGMHACFVETLLLALEGRLTNYSIGRGRISVEKMHEIGLMAEKYSFHPVFSWDNVVYREDRLPRFFNITTSRSRRYDQFHAG